MIYHPGDKVLTPNGVGIVTGCNRGPARGQGWREPIYSVNLSGRRTQWHREGDLKFSR